MTHDNDIDFPIRINRYLALKRYASRRGADQLVEGGLVTINGTIATLGDQVQENDIVEVIDHTPHSNVYLAYYKPRGIVTVGAQENETEIADILEYKIPVFPVGRLDKDSEGLIILTNDGRLTTQLLDTNTEKEYAVTVDKPIAHSFLVHMRNGVKIKIPTKGGQKRWYTTKPTKVRRTGPTTFEIVLTEGKNRQIRRMCSALGYSVTQLKRFRIDEIDLGNLSSGQYRKIKGDTFSL